MKYLLPLPLIFFGVMFYIGNSTPEVQPPLNKASSEKNQKKKRNKKDIVYRQKKSADPILFVKKNEKRSDWDDMRFENRWQEELFYLLKKLDPDRGEEIFYTYLEEMRAHHHKTKENLRLALDGLSMLNAESGLEPEVEKGRSPASTVDPINLEREHERKIKNILGKHYEIIHEQEKLFLEENPEELSI